MYIFLCAYAKNPASDCSVSNSKYWSSLSDSFGSFLSVLSGTSRENKQVHFCFSGCVLESDVPETFRPVSSSGSAWWLTDLFHVPSHILRTFHVIYSYIKPSDLDTGFLL